MTRPRARSAAAPPPGTRPRSGAPRRCRRCRPRTAASRPPGAGPDGDVLPVHRLRAGHRELGEQPPACVDREQARGVTGVVVRPEHAALRVREREAGELGGLRRGDRSGDLGAQVGRRGPDARSCARARAAGRSGIVAAAARRDGERGRARHERRRLLARCGPHLRSIVAHRAAWTTSRVTFVRYGIPALLVLAGVVCLFVAPVRLGRGGLRALHRRRPVGAAPERPLPDGRERRRASATARTQARAHFAEHGSWPDEERPRRRGPGALPENIATPESEEAERDARVRKLSVSSMPSGGDIPPGPRGGDRHYRGEGHLRAGSRRSALRCSLALAGHRRRGHPGGSLRRPEPVPLPDTARGHRHELPRPGRRPVLRRVRQAQPERDGPRHRRLPLQGAGPRGRGQPQVLLPPDRPLDRLGRAGPAAGAVALGRPLLLRQGQGRRRRLPVEHPPRRRGGGPAPPPRLPDAALAVLRPGRAAAPGS